jgi:FkbM family methyltransferase
MLNQTGRLLLKPFLGKRQFQWAFQMLYKTGLAGMNIGEGGRTHQSGEPWVAKFIHSRLVARNESAVIFDVGANVGQFALHILPVFGNDARLWSFEPCASSFAKLQKNLAPYNNVVLVNAALGAKVGQVQIFSPSPDSQLASFYNRSLAWQADAAAEQAACTTIDQFCTEQRIQRIHFLKIDVEGHELAVLQGAETMLASRAIDFIQFEISAAHIDARVFFRDFYQLLATKYQLYRVLQNGLMPLHQYKPEMEAYKNATNYLAVLKPCSNGGPPYPVT